MPAPRRYSSLGRIGRGASSCKSLEVCSRGLSHGCDRPLHMYGLYSYSILLVGRRTIVADSRSLTLIILPRRLTTVSFFLGPCFH